MPPYAEQLKDRIKAWMTVRENQILSAIVLFAFLLRLSYALSSGMWWDEARYAEFGRGLLSHPLNYSSGIEGGGPITLYSPVLPYLLFISQAVFGAGLIGARLVNVVLGTIGVAGIYYLGKALYNEKAGLVAAALLSVSPQFWFLNERALMETPEVVFMILTMALFYFGIEKENKYALWASGAAAALGYLSRMSAGFLIPIILVYLVLTRKAKWVKNKNLWIAAAIGIVFLLPWVARSLSVCEVPFCEMGSGLRTIEPVQNSPGVYQFELMVEIMQLPNMLSGGVFLLSLLGIILALRKRSRSDIFTLVWAAVFFAVGTQLYVEDIRRMMFLLPPFVIFAARAIETIGGQVNIDSVPKYAIIALLTAPLLFYSAAEGHAMIVSKAPGFAKLKDAGEYFRDMPQNTKILAGSPNQLAFFSGGKNVTNYYPQKQEDFAKTLKEQNYDYVVMDGYEPTQPQWIFSYLQQQKYLNAVMAFSEGNQPVVVILKVNRQMLNEAEDGVNRTQQ